MGGCKEPSTPLNHRWDHLQHSGFSSLTVFWSSVPWQLTDRCAISCRGRAMLPAASSSESCSGARLCPPPLHHHPTGLVPGRPHSLLDPTTVSHRSGSLVLHTSRYSLNINSSLSPTSHYYVFNHFPRNTHTHARTRSYTHTHTVLATFRSTVRYKKHTVCYADKHNLSFVQVCPCKVARSLTKRYVFVWTQCSSSLCWTKNMANTTCSSCRDFYSQNIWEDD